MSLPRGWSWPIYAEQAHYFVKGLSLCKRWVLPRGAMPEDDKHWHSANCPECKEQLEKQYPGKIHGWPP